MNTEITCPYCDYEFADSNDVDMCVEGSTTIQCPNCDETFECERIIKYKSFINIEEDADDSSICDSRE